MILEQNFCYKNAQLSKFLTKLRELLAHIGFENISPTGNRFCVVSSSKGRKDHALHYLTMG